MPYILRDNDCVYENKDILIFIFCGVVPDKRYWCKLTLPSGRSPHAQERISISVCEEEGPIHEEFDVGKFNGEECAHGEICAIFNEIKEMNHFDLVQYFWKHINFHFSKDTQFISEPRESFFDCATASYDTFVSILEGCAIFHNMHLSSIDAMLTCKIYENKEGDIKIKDMISSQNMISPSFNEACIKLLSSLAPRGIEWLLAFPERANQCGSYIRSPLTFYVYRGKISRLSSRERLQRVHTYLAYAN